MGYERNGIMSVMNPRMMMRFGLVGLMLLGFWQMWRVPIWGQVEEMEMHSLNFDNIVYDKLSTRNVPYHCASSFP